jgi:hypothetical protein
MQEGQVNQTCSRKLAGILNVPLGLSTCKLESDDCIAILGLGRNFTAQSVFGKLPVLHDNNRATRHNLRPSKSTKSAAGRRRLCEVEAVAFGVEPRKAEIPAMGNCIRWIGKGNLRSPFSLSVQVADTPCPAVLMSSCPALRNGTFARVLSGDF